MLGAIETIARRPRQGSSRLVLEEYQKVSVCLPVEPLNGGSKEDYMIDLFGPFGHKRAIF